MELTNYDIQASGIIVLDLGLRMIMNKCGQQIGCCTAAHTWREGTPTFNELLYKASYLNEAFPKTIN
jgi:hypothetical protein